MARASWLERPWARLAGGFLVGFLAVPLVGYPTMTAMQASGMVRVPGAGRASLELAGRDVSLAGAVAIEAQRVGDRVRLDCRGACDDLRLERIGSPGLLEVRALDEHGICVVCEKPTATRSMEERWRLAGRPLALVHE